MNFLTSGWISKLSKLAIVALLILPGSFVALQASIVKAAGNTYYVDTNGSDANDGTSLSTPFQTIQQAASVVTAGDTVLIRGGTYRETVTPANSGTSENPITYQNYNDETVTVSGADLLSDWTLDSGSIYKASMNWDLGAGNQIFVNGVMIDEARWPNQTGTLMNPTGSIADAGSSATQIVDTALPGGDDYWNGATVWIPSGWAWIAQTPTVTDYNSVNKKLSITGLRASGGYSPAAGNKFYLSGIKAALDTEREWWYDAANSELYVWVPGGGDPSTYTVEAKHRNASFDLSGKAYITIDGIQTIASTILTDNASNHNTLQSIVAKYLSHNKLNTLALEQENLGFLLNGSYNVLRDSELAYSSGSLITVGGSYNNVINCYIHEGGYVPDWEGLVNLKGANSLISHNTVSDAGRVTIYFSAGMSANEIEYNDIFNAGWMTDDLGMLYGPNTDGQNTEIHHNFVHDNKAHSTRPGIYLDNYVNNFIIHHNVMWNNSGLQLNNPSNYNLVYNNTAWTGTTTVQAWGAVFGTDMYGDRIFNNIIKGYDPEVTAYATYGSNLMSNPGFVNESGGDYRLSPTSLAVDTGIVIPGITDGFVGNSPDIGALEYGGTDWTASVGHNFENPSNTTYEKPSTPFMNRVVNGGFEYGDLSSWNPTDDGNAVVINDNHWGKQTNQGMSRSQFYGLKLSGGVDGAEQTITGLQPNTNYFAAGWLRSPAGETGAIGVKDFGGSEVSTTSSSSTWMFVKVKFKTGPANTSATIYFKKTSTAAGEFYFDDAGVVPDATVYQSIYSFDGFESDLSNWGTGAGTATLSSAQVHSGSNSYIIDEDREFIAQQFDSAYNKVVSIWFYDNAKATRMQTGVFVDDSLDGRGILVNTPTSTTKYVYRIGGTHYSSNVTRTTGWHEFKFDYTSGTKVDMYIDGVLVASPVGVTNFNRIVIGDLWTPNVNTVYFDDISIMSLPVAPIQNNNVGSGNGKITLNWAGVAEAIGYKVKYGTVSGEYTSTIDVGNVSETTIEDLKNGVTYYFAISAYNSAGDSRNSNETIGTPDGIAPSTQAVIDGEKGSNDWFTSDVAVSLEAQDENAGITSTEYALNIIQRTDGQQSTEGFVPYTVPLLLSEGIFELHYRSTDRAGNVEASKTIIVNVDKAAPTTVITANGSPLVGGEAFLDSQLLTVNVQAEDKYSGLAAQTITVDGVEAPTGLNVLDWAGQLGDHFIKVVATDLAGNMKITTINVKVATDEDSMQKLIDRFVATGEITGPLKVQITNKFRQSLDHHRKGHTDQAIKHMQDVLKVLEKTEPGEISSYVKQVLTADANALIAAWSE